LGVYRTDSMANIAFEWHIEVQVRPHPINTSDDAELNSLRETLAADYGKAIFFETPHPHF